VIPRAGGPLNADRRRVARQGRSMLSEETTKDGAFMEPRGCSRWQPLANRVVAISPKTSENRCRPLRSVAAWSAW
jgi:hypothetical protein